MAVVDFREWITGLHVIANLPVQHNADAVVDGVLDSFSARPEHQCGEPQKLGVDRSDVP